MDIFKATHKIHDGSNAVVVRAVRSTTDDILFFTKEEWSAAANSAAWTMQPSGKLAFRGEPKFNVWIESLEER